MPLFCSLTDLMNESDVEQKLILPLLTSSPPLGFGYLVSDFRTKSDLRQILINKGVQAKLYYPDYLVILHGLPLMIIEAKHPKEDIRNALREGRLYATEINSQFPKGINPCHKIIVSNGSELIASFWDSSTEFITVPFEHIHIENPDYHSLIDFASRDTIWKFCENIYKEIRQKTVFVKPLRLVGGKVVQHQELEQNSFGTSLALDNRNIFNPNTTENRIQIVRNAYVPSRKRLKHVEPISKIIQAAKPPSITGATLIEDTGKPIEILNKLSNVKSLTHEMILLIGSVGSGKSTFVDYLREIGLSDEVKEKTVWVSVDLNVAPLSRDIIYNWIREQLISTLKLTHGEIDFEDLSIIRKFFSVELKKVEKGPGALLEKDSKEYNYLISSTILKLQQDPQSYAGALVRYLCAERGKTLIIVLDNCDKRNRDDQLLMFEVAKWLRTIYECIVFLPLRDTTYDHHRTDPPLDTTIKDLVFRIDPPLLMDVLYRRVKYALSLMKSDDKNLLSYELPNGMRVEYPQSEQGVYLACILRSLFQYDNYFGRLIMGIAGRDIRKGLEIFLDFCKSGHIDASEIFAIRHSKGDHILPRHIVTRVLLRGNKKYYHDAGSNIRSLFFCLPEETIPDPFIRVSILQWLKNRYRLPGPSGIRGFHKTSKLISNLNAYGHTVERIQSEIINLMKARSIQSEAQDPEKVEMEDLISITPCGHVHLDLLPNVDYLAACSEDTWYRDQETAKKISGRMINQIGRGHLSRESSLENAEDLLKYLIKYRDTFISNPDAYLSEGKYEKLLDLNSILEAVQNTRKQEMQIVGEEIDKIIKEYPPGSIVEAEVVSIQNFGVIVEFGLNATGYIKSFLFTREGKLAFEDLDNGDLIKAKVLKFNEKYKRFNLEPISDS